jgi:hypothetical protein
MTYSEPIWIQSHSFWVFSLSIFVCAGTRKWKHCQWTVICVHHYSWSDTSNTWYFAGWNEEDTRSAVKCCRKEMKCHLLTKNVIICNDVTLLTGLLKKNNLAKYEEERIIWKCLSEIWFCESYSIILWCSLRLSGFPSVQTIYHPRPWNKVPWTLSLHSPSQHSCPVQPICSHKC